MVPHQVGVGPSISLYSITISIHQLIYIKDKLADLGPIHPGSLSEQYNVCGTPGCRCKDPKNPVKHGPYYQLSYSVEVTREKIANYKRLRELTAEWVDLAIALETLERETG